MWFEEEEVEMDLNGRWRDMNGGEIEIRHDGRKVVATGLNQAVKKHLTKGEGILRGRVLRMTHFRDGQETDRKTGTVSEGVDRIDWSLRNGWTRLSGPDGDGP